MKKRRHADVIIDEVARPGELPILIIKGAGMPHGIAWMPGDSASLTQDAGTLFVACRATCPGFQAFCGTNLKRNQFVHELQEARNHQSAVLLNAKTTEIFGDDATRLKTHLKSLRKKLIDEHDT